QLPMSPNPLTRRRVRRLSIEENRRILALVERDVVHPLQRGLFTAQLVHECDVLVDVPGRIPVAWPKLVLLRIHVLLAAWLDRNVLDELEAGVDPVQRRQRRGEHQPNPERGPTALDEVLVENIRRIREEVLAIVLDWAALKLFHVGAE